LVSRKVDVKEKMWVAKKVGQLAHGRVEKTVAWMAARLVVQSESLMVDL